MTTNVQQGNGKVIHRWGAFSLAMRTGCFISIVALAMTFVVCADASQSSTPERDTGLPVAAKSRISAVLGEDISEYRACRSRAGIEVKNAKQELTANFAASGVEIQAGGEHWRMLLLGYGYGDALKTAARIDPQAKSNLVEYRRGALTEWYVNGPAGIEQGFTILERPGNGDSQPLTIALALSGNLGATLEKGGRALTLERDRDHAVLRYTDLSAYDATGRELPAWLEMHGNRLLLQVHDGDAAYPIVVDPFVQHAELTASDGAANDNFGTSVAINGNTIVVGAPNALIGSSDFGQGAAYVFVKPTTGWANMTQTAKLTASNPNTNEVHFGASVAISGNTVVVGAPRAFVGVIGQVGTAYVFVMPSTGWVNTTETARLTPSDGAAGDSFGQSVAISGGTVMVGSPNATIGSNSFQGAVYVFIKPGTGWTNLNKNTKLTASDGQSGDALGTSVAISGTTVVAGAPLAAVGSNSHQGKSYVYVKPATGGWKTANETAELTASDGVQGDEFGTSVAIGGTTPTIVVGASAEVDSNIRGSAYIYVKPTAGWATTSAFTAKLTSSDSQAGDHFGVGVAITGKTVAIGADQPLGTGPGAVYIYVEPTTGWATTSTFTQKLHSSDGVSGDQFGTSVAETTGRVVAGALGHAVGTNFSRGDAYVF